MAFCLSNAYSPGKKHVEFFGRNSSVGEVTVTVTLAYRNTTSSGDAPADRTIVFKRSFELARMSKDSYFVDGKQETYESYGFKLIQYGIPFFGKERVPLILVGQSEVLYICLN